RAQGYYSATGSPTATIAMLLGTTTIGSSGAVTVGSSPITNAHWSFDFDFVCESIGSSGSIIGQGLVAFSTGSGGMSFQPIVNTSAITLNTTTFPQAIKLTWQWSATGN